MRPLLLALACTLLAASAAEPTANPGLAAKAAHFRAALVDRHVAPEGLVLYRLDLRTAASDLERGTYPDLSDTPTFTGLWAATSCLRARLEPRGARRAEALGDARRALDGLRLLGDVTGRPGLLARVARRHATPLPDEAAKPHARWFAGAPGLEAYRWRGDVSVDQYANGLLPAAAECAAAFPERSRRLAVDFAAMLLENDFRLVDPDGRPTRFGDLSWRSGFGFNSIAALTSYTALALAHDLGGDPRFARAATELRQRYRVAARSRLTNLRVLGITNHSNDLMAWNLYRVIVPLARRSGDPALADLRHGMHRTRLRARADGNAYFEALHCYVEPATCDRDALAAARRLLERFPLEKRRLATPPGLAAIPTRWLPGRKGKRLARAVVPIESRPVSSFEWKSSPYRVEAHPAPHIQYTGLDFLVAYWTLVAAERASGVKRGAVQADPGGMPGPSPADLGRFLAKFRPAIIVLSGDASGLEFILDQRRSLIGRGPGVDLALDEPSLEREHASVEFTGRGFRVARVSSEAALEVRGTSVAEAELKPGDRFRLAGLAFSFEVETR